MLKVSFEREINADIEKAFDVITNFENFQNLFPEFYPSILIKSVRDESSLVAEHLKLHDKEFIIMSKHFFSKPNTHEMRVVGGDIKGSSINEIFSIIIMCFNSCPNSKNIRIKNYIFRRKADFVS